MAIDAHEDPAFQAMCREHEIEGTEMVALCGAFWNRALASTTGEAEPMPEGWKLVEKKTCYALLDGDTVVASLAGPDAERYAAIIARNLATPSAATPAAPGDSEVLALFKRNCVTYSGNYEVTPGQALRIAAALSIPAPVAAPADTVAWGLCPVCGEGGMRYSRTASDEPALIHCTNHACRSNGGEYDKAAPAPASEAVAGVAFWIDKSCVEDVRETTMLYNVKIYSERAGDPRLVPVYLAVDSADAPVQQAGEIKRLQTILANLRQKITDAAFGLSGKIPSNHHIDILIRQRDEARAALKGEQPVERKDGA